MRVRSTLARCGALPLLLGASEPVRLQPSTPWVVDYAENSCRLVRYFGEDKTKTTFALESAAPGEIDMLVIGKPLATLSEEVSARFLPLGKDIKGEVAQTSTSHQPAILWSSFAFASAAFLARHEAETEQRRKHPEIRPPAVSLEEQAQNKAEFEAFATATTELAIQTRHGRQVVLELGSLAKPLKAFNQCNTDSLKDWGVDAEVEDKIVRPVWTTNPT